MNLPVILESKETTILNEENQYLGDIRLHVKMLFKTICCYINKRFEERNLIMLKAML